MGSGANQFISHATVIPPLVVEDSGALKSLEGGDIGLAYIIGGQFAACTFGSPAAKAIACIKVIGLRFER